MRERIADWAAEARRVAASAPVEYGNDAAGGAGTTYVLTGSSLCARAPRRAARRHRRVRDEHALHGGRGGQRVRQRRAGGGVGRGAHDEHDPHLAQPREQPDRERAPPRCGATRRCASSSSPREADQPGGGGGDGSPPTARSPSSRSRQRARARERIGPHADRQPRRAPRRRGGATATTARRTARRCASPTGRRRRSASRRASCGVCQRRGGGGPRPRRSARADGAGAGGGRLRDDKLVAVGARAARRAARRHRRLRGEHALHGGRRHERVRERALAAASGRGLTTNTTLTSLNLESNQIASAGIEAAARCGAPREPPPRRASISQAAEEQIARGGARVELDDHKADARHARRARATHREGLARQPGAAARRRRRTRTSRSRTRRWGGEDRTLL